MMTNTNAVGAFTVAPPIMSRKAMIDVVAIVPMNPIYMAADRRAIFSSPRASDLILIG